jgi:mRNA-degrading endonuclease RelE of RelBE toxin-antitoxin system
MRFAIILAPSAVATLRALPAYRRATVQDAIETHLCHEPTKVSRSRIKRLRGLTRPQYRLRVEEERVFYDVIDQEVQILAIVSKEEADAWLRAYGEAGP